MCRPPQHTRAQGSSAPLHLCALPAVAQLFLELCSARGHPRWSWVFHVATDGRQESDAGGGKRYNSRAPPPTHTAPCCASEAACGTAVGEQRRVAPIGVGRREVDVIDSMLRRRSLKRSRTEDNLALLESTGGRTLEALDRSPLSINYSDAQAESDDGIGYDSDTQLGTRRRKSGASRWGGRGPSWTARGK